MSWDVDNNMPCTSLKTKPSNEFFVCYIFLFFLEILVLLIFKISFPAFLKRSKYCYLIKTFSH